MRATSPARSLRHRSPHVHAARALQSRSGRSRGIPAAEDKPAVLVPAPHRPVCAICPHGEPAWLALPCVVVSAASRHHAAAWAAVQVVWGQVNPTHLASPHPVARTSHAVRRAIPSSVVVQCVVIGTSACRPAADSCYCAAGHPVAPDGGESRGTCEYQTASCTPGHVQ